MVIALNFGEWWQSTGNKILRDLQRDKTVVPPPSLEMQDKKCPVCHHRSFRQPCVFKDTGVVYCFDCLQVLVKRTLPDDPGAFDRLLLQQNRIIKLYI